MRREGSNHVASTKNTVIDAEERAALGELAFTIGAKYAAHSFGDREATRRQWLEVCKAGFAGISIPEEYGGAGSIADLMFVSERLAAGGFPALKLTIQTAVAGAVIARHASDEQRKKWLPGLADGSVTFCFALTEPGAGSNSARLQTKARRAPGGGWLISGQKTYISAVDDSDMMFLVARDAESGGLSLFAFPLPIDGMDKQIVDVMVRVGDHQWTVYFDDVRLPDDALIGRPGEANKALFDALNPERLIVAAQAVGIARWCLRQAAEYANTREVFDGPIGVYQAVQHPLAEAYVEVEAAWLLIEKGCAAFEAGERGAGLLCNMAKLKACDAGLQAASSALQVFGGSGYTAETMMFDRFAYLRLLRSVPVARELVLNHVAMAGLGLPKSY
jgi:alkylation response protein AidB-like acyl-CoA dehydrogenase